MMHRSFIGCQNLFCFSVDAGKISRVLLLPLRTKAALHPPVYTQKRRSKKRRRDFSYGFDSMMTAGWENQNSSSSLRIVRSVFFFLFIIYRGKRNGANVTSSSRTAYYIKRSLRVCLTAICMQNRWREPTAAILNPPRTENFLFISSAAKQLDEIFEGGTS